MGGALPAQSWAWRPGRGPAARWSSARAPGDALPALPQEEETLSFIRDSLEKSDQLTKNMVSNASVRGS